MITIPVKPLREALSGFNRLALAQQKLPVLRSVLVKSENGWLSLAGTDLDQRLTYQTRIENPDKEEILVPLDTLKGVVKNRSVRAEIRIHPGTQRHRIQIKEGEDITEVGCSALDVRKFPADETGLEKLTVLPEAAMTSILDAVPTASTDPTREILQSILVEPESVVSTNGQQLFRSNSLKLDLSDSVMVPAMKTLKVFDPGKTAHLFRSKGKRPVLRLLQGDWEWTFRSPEGQYPDYRQVFPKSDENRVKVVLSEADVSLIQELGRLAELTDKNALTGLRVEKGKLLLMVGSKDNRQVHPLQPERIEGEGTRFVFFQYSFLLLGIGQGMRRLSLLDELSSVVMEGDHRMNLFMPVRGVVAEAEWGKRLISREGKDKPAPTPEPVPTKAESPTGKDKEADDPLAVLMDETTAIRDRLRDLAGDLNQLVKGVRRVQRDRSERERDHTALKRTIRSLQRLGV